MGLSTGVTHILDFGPGGNDGVGGSANFAAQLTDGKGVQVIVCHADTVSRDDIPNIFGLSGASPRRSHRPSCCFCCCCYR